MPEDKVSKRLNFSRSVSTKFHTRETADLNENLVKAGIPKVVVGTNKLSVSQSVKIPRSQTEATFNTPKKDTGEQSSLPSIAFTFGLENFDLEGHWRDSPLKNSRSKSPSFFSFKKEAKDKQFDINDPSQYRPEILRILGFSEVPLLRPILKNKDKRFKKDGVGISKNILSYAGIGIYAKGSKGSNCGNVKILDDIFTKIWAHQGQGSSNPMIDELFCQLVKQTRYSVSKIF